MTALDIHATCLCLDGAGVLLRGASGSGKSDLALRLIEGGGARLVGDDYCDFALRDGRLLVRPRAAGAGLLEVRGLGLLRLPDVWLAAETAVVAVIDLHPGPPADRLPEVRWTELWGVSLRHFVLDPAPPSAAAKVRLAVALASGTMAALA
jgi:serine kinase of HPr protein (carbohydrate metabolism regulator)